MIFTIFHLCSVIVPYGNTKTIGAFQECLSVNHHQLESDTTYNIIGT